MPNPRVPDNVLKMRGTYRPDRHGDADEKVELEEKPPTAPGWLGREAKREWRRICKLLTGKGVLADLDRPLLAQYCTLWQALYESQTWRRRYMAGDQTIDPDNPPRFSASDHAQMRMLGGELGIGAVSRSKIKVQKKPEPQKKTDGWDGI